jgi:adenosylmethionine-8-amino-7-oxononanoate aminotransferase
MNPGERHYPLWELLVPPGSYGKPERRAVAATGARLRFDDGSQVLDATSGLWNVNLGYGNTAVADAVDRAMREASYLTLFRYAHTYALDAARALTDAAGPAVFRRVIFSTSGSSANDLVMKTARHHAVLNGEPQRRLVVGFKGSYHGLTYGAFSLSGEELGQHLYGVDTRLVRHVDPDRPEDLERLMRREGHRVAAVVCEPVFGSGARELPPATLAALLELRREYGFLLVADEVATGYGRTGPLFASSAWAQPPDLLVTSKGLTNGTCAASAVLASHAVCDAFERADALLVHGETQAGTPPTCAAITATLEQFAELSALESGARVASALDTLLGELAAELPSVTATTGRGCFRGIQLAEDDGAPYSAERVQQAIAAIRGHGALVHPGPGCVQLVPPLTLTDEETHELGTAVHKGLAEVR